VPASELITEVVERESLRLLTWAEQHTSPAIARPAVASAFSSLWRQATACWRSADGPVAFLLTATEAAIRRSPARVGTYLPKTARRTLTLPTLDELDRAAYAYAWLSMAATNPPLEFTRASMVVAAINARGVPDLVLRSVHEHSYEPVMGRQVVTRLLDVVDHLVKADGEPAVRARHFAMREFERSRRWLALLPVGPG
jgi:hypothetical protein